MKRCHLPEINVRYWVAITLSSIFGTNLGDLYAHKSGLGLIRGVGVLAVLVALSFAGERFDDRRHEAYYWLVIILIRTGATNIADYLAYVAKVPPVALGSGITMLLMLFAWMSATRGDSASKGVGAPLNAGAAYWLAMLTAGVFGTLAGDLCSDNFGEGISSLGLGVILFIILFAAHRRAAKTVALYWLTVAVARTAGTSIGDWIADNKLLNIGLSVSTVITGLAFASVLLFWRRKQGADESVRAAA